MGNGGIASRRPPEMSKELKELMELRQSLSSDPQQLELCSNLVALRQRYSRLKDRIRVEESSAEPDWDYISSLRAKQKGLNRPIQLMQSQVESYWRRVDQLNRLIEAAVAGE